MKGNFSFKVVHVFSHIVFWIAFYLTAFIDPRGVHPINKLNANFFFDFHLLINHAFFIFFFYFNSNFLIPHFLSNGKKIQYSVLVFFLFVTILILSYFLFPFIRLPFEQINARPLHLPSKEVMRINQTISLSVPLFFVLMVSVTYRLTFNKYKQDKVNKERENEHLKTELSFLRSQISPHFIFNALNSSIILVRKKSDLAEESLLKLASLLRYMLYESDDDKVSIQNEIQYISDYIDLQKIRFGNSVIILKSIEIDDTIEGAIEPMLLIPFIENAFKHGTNVISSPEIQILIHKEQNSLVVEVKNKFIKSIQNNTQSDKNHGIGLVNVKRRLELLYPANHVLDINAEDGWYSVYLSLEILE
jgi:sensor histidine kinase YesM